MPKFFNATSFACGVFAVSVLVCAIGAARNGPSDGNKYDATQIMHPGWRNDISSITTQNPLVTPTVRITRRTMSYPTS